MFNFSMTELVLVLVIALVVFGPSKLPELGKALGRGISEFKQATTGTPKKEEIIEAEVVKVDSKPEEKK